MNEEKEQSGYVYVNSLMIARRIADFLSKNNENIDSEVLYQVVKSYITKEDLIDDVYRETIHLLEDRYGIIFDVDKKVDI